MEKLSCAAASVLLENGFIESDKYDACKYGMKNFFTAVGELMFVIALSILFRNFTAAIIWLAAFAPLRIYGGGYHADTKLRCFMIFIGVYIIFSIVISTVRINTAAALIISVGTVICMCLFAPLRHKNKHLNNREITAFRKIAVSISLIECVIVLILIFRFEISSNIYAFLLGMLTASLSLICGKIKNIIGGDNSG